MPFDPGSTLGPFKIQSLLGKGGMGEVFSALDTRLDRKVALKILPADFASDSDRLRRFQSEAKTLASLNHPNILVIYEVGADGTSFSRAAVLISTFNCPASIFCTVRQFRSDFHA